MYTFSSTSRRDLADLFCNMYIMSAFQLPLGVNLVSLRGNVDNDSFSSLEQQSDFLVDLAVYLLPSRKVMKSNMLQWVFCLFWYGIRKLGRKGIDLQEEAYGARVYYKITH